MSAKNQSALNPGAFAVLAGEEFEREHAKPDLKINFAQLS